jgi:general secretion pathway protein A
MEANMTNQYRPYFGFKREPFPTDVPTRDLLQLPGMLGIKQRFDYCLEIGGVMVVTGEVGSGKSTSLRWSTSQAHPSEVFIADVTANSGSIAEIYKLICLALGLQPGPMSRSKLITDAKNTIRDLVTSKKQKIVLIVDEANLMRPEIFTELHTLGQFDHDYKNLLTLILCGQSSLLDKLAYRGAAPLASRVIARAHLDTLSEAQLADYIAHHVKIAGVNKGLFDKNALVAIYQGSGGLLRKSNSLARGGLMAAAIEKATSVTAEHIRIAASELL